MAVTIPNTERIRHTADSTVADALQQVTNYVNKNVTQKPGTRKAPPVRGNRPIHPTP
jgi:hypothetical protein